MAIAQSAEASFVSVPFGRRTSEPSTEFESSAAVAVPSTRFTGAAKPVMFAAVIEPS